jgi:hypothetical protein
MLSFDARDGACDGMGGEYVGDADLRWLHQGFGGVDVSDFHPAAGGEAFHRSCFAGSVQGHPAFPHIVE